jgi:hypothetical protein
LSPEVQPAQPILQAALVCWAGLGIVSPAIIATATRNPAERDDLAEPVRDEARLARYIGAYLGYALGGLAWIIAVLALWIIGPLVFVPLGPVPTLTFAAILASLLLSYSAARSQSMSAAVIAPVTPGLYSGSTLFVVIIGALVMLAAPFLLLALPAGLLNPSAIGLVLALTLLTAVLRG